MSRSRTLFVAGFNSDMRARDLAWEFERFGRLVRCDIPAPKTPAAKPYAFIEYEDGRDADEAQYQMDRRRLRTRDGDSDPLTVQFSRQPPSSTWRHEGSYETRDRDREPVRRSPPRDNYRRRSPSPPPRGGGRGRSRSPAPRQRSPVRGDDSAGSYSRR